MTTLPQPNFDPPFRITRASHLVLDVRDLERSRLFYEEVIGLIPTLVEAECVYYRGIEEACHHSLVLHRTTGERACRHIGMRMLTEDDLERGFAHFAAHGCAPEWVEVLYQGKTFRVRDPFGTPLEFCARMPVMPRQITNFASHRGGCAQRIDHYQILVPDVLTACLFYANMGFQLTEYIETAAGDLRGVFLQRKGNPHDIVFFAGDGPRLHHAAFVAPEVQNLLKACDVAGALGFGRGVERGPGRHGPGHAMFVYFRDPDGHRIELFNTHYQVMDIEIEPVRWDPADPNVSFPWGLPARRSWFDETTPFAGAVLRRLEGAGSPLTLEKFLAAEG